MSFFHDTPEHPPAPNGAPTPPPPAGEHDYGENVVSIKRRGKKTVEGWKAEWHTSDSGSPLPTLFNAMLAMRNHPKLSALVRYDEMARSPILCDQIPNTPHDPTIPRGLRDSDVLAIQEELQLTGLRRIAKATAQDAIDLRARQDSFHPVRDYLRSLAWDGRFRLGAWLGTYLGVEDCDYSAGIGQMFMIALVARQFEPGCQADYMLILEGPQGTLKSSACRALAGEWFSDNLPDLSRGDAVRLSMHLRGKWLIEIAEMSSFNAAETHTLKEFITQTSERYTPKYGRNEVYEPRQCLFVGTTNEATYLRDSTGARRFWPVKVGTINLDALSTDRDQLFAEAVHCYREGEPWWPTNDFAAQHIVPQQEERYEEDPWEAAIVEWILQNAIKRCTVTEVLKGPIDLATSHLGTREHRRVTAIFRHLGWVSAKSNGKRSYERPNGWPKT